MARERLKKNNLIYLLNKYIKSVLWGLAVRLSCVQDTWCLRLNFITFNPIRADK